MKHSLIALILAATMCAAFTPANASPIYNQPADLTGSRSANNGLITTGPYADTRYNFTLAWKISPIANGYHYRYTFSGYKKALSHVILDLSDDCTATSGCVFNLRPSVTTTYNTFGPASSNPSFPPHATITGIKFDNLGSPIPLTLEFDSARRPVWGDFYTKGGRDPRTGLFAVAYNRGLGYESSSTDPIDFIARPDGEVPAATPEPATFLLLGTAVVALGLLTRRQRAQ